MESLGTQGRRDKVLKISFYGEEERNEK